MNLGYGGLSVANGGAATTLTFAGIARNGAVLNVDLSSGAGANTLAFTSTAGLSTSPMGWVTVQDASGLGFGMLSGNNIVRNAAGTTALIGTANSGTTPYTTNPSTDTSAGQYSGGVLTMSGGPNALAVAGDYRGRRLYARPGRQHDEPGQRRRGS